ncbi:histidine phosphatase family protein [Corynebacterium sp. 153RC1]|uniref:histidine phosphatase family protein n=1 Tax=unclassified Corynebacterium TaxID=2624378 RepID=UPI00211BD2DA|nr:MULTISPECIES: histidine phosphatase family protein [unclassified Corynebacterium]MCQ9371286.1 histidine phosphatase family protein [Corynebacterium sp. 35RC1]MCQ9353243.1 histidine phosphatase family protein [Corynebacterium sp. 209RC1]MCQ9355383.1 histidine phosphatase family protein [Corynebacterium sp. 1222RC1]MCQ9357115.1 histidine phosphatase family protein [Corynebacterium sp. 122RC1]MCQ9358924.1 histidine phosphatase family protein [Corynebacterium sp. 142RC1]
MTRRLILLRHGQTEYNATGRMQGHLDTHLSDVGIQQAKAVAKVLADFGVGRIVSSDLTRAKDTAEVIAEQLALPITTDARLRETNLGDWQGKSHGEVDVAHPGARAVWRHDASWAPPQGESRLDVARRARAVIDEQMRSYESWDDETLLIVAHGGTISALTSNLLGLDVSQYPLLSGLGNTCWSQLTGRPVFDREDPHAPMRFTAEDPQPAQWYLDAWNRGVL